MASTTITCSIVDHHVALIDGLPVMDVQVRYHFALSPLADQLAGYSYGGSDLQEIQAAAVATIQAAAPPATSAAAQTLFTTAYMGALIDKLINDGRWVA